jgi:hypothetical protein
MAEHIVETTLKRIIQTGEAASVKGKTVDTFTANMLMTVVNKLSEQNKQQLFNRSINEMVAVAYKVLTH